MKRKSFLKQFGFALPIGLAILLISSPTGAQNLYIVDVVPASPASYIAADTQLALTGDDFYVDVPLPFPFTFYKKAYTSARVSTNGHLSFTAGNSQSIGKDPFYRNAALPDPAAPNGAIYPFWDDLVVDSAASVRTQLLGTEPKRQFVIEWRNVTIFQDRLTRFYFEIVLHENGVILLQYSKVASARQMGSSATVGIEDEAAISAVQFSYNQASIGAGDYAIRIAPAPKPVSVDIKPRACPNRLDVDSHGVLHVAILGTSDLDVTTIDPKTVTMGGVAVLSKEMDPLKTKRKMKLVASKLCHQGWILEDVGTPYEPFDGKTDPNQCNNLGPDGNLDIVLRFATHAIAESLGDVEDEEAITLQLRGQLLDGTEIKGEDVVIIMDKEKRYGHYRGHHGGHDKDRHDKDRGHGHDKDRGHGHDGKHD